jgi:hypothetical protein
LGLHQLQPNCTARLNDGRGDPFVGAVSAGPTAALLHRRPDLVPGLPGPNTSTGSGSPLCQDAVGSVVLGLVVTGPGSG